MSAFWSLYLGTRCTVDRLLEGTGKDDSNETSGSVAGKGGCIRCCKKPVTCLSQTRKTGFGSTPFSPDQVLIFSDLLSDYDSTFDLSLSLSPPERQESAKELSTISVDELKTLLTLMREQFFELCNTALPKTLLHEEKNKPSIHAVTCGRYL